MSFMEQLYRLALAATRPTLPLLARGEGKLARGIRGRHGVLERMEKWATEARDPGRPLLWMHAPSVGEGLQARAVMREIRRRRPDVQMVYTHFSPSAEGFARSVPAELVDYLPLDLPVEVGRALELIRPDVLAFSKTDVWPILTREAQRRGVRLAMVSGTLPPTSSRTRGLALRLLGPAYRRLDHVAAISAADAERFGALGVPPRRRSVMGDARFDQVWERAQGVDRKSSLLRRLHSPERPVLVAGSTWPADEDRLLEALSALRAEGVAYRVVLVPHEPSPTHLARVEARLEALGVAHRRLSAVESEATDAPEVTVVDRVGILGELYAAADVAYVGGGFGSAGLHSVLEPAAFGVPVLFGPHHANAREAAELIEAGGARSVANVRGLEDALGGWLRDGTARRGAGARARAYVEAGLGAAERGAESLLRLLPV